MPFTLNTYTGRRLQPCMHPEDARSISVQLGVSLTLPAGTVLGEVAATPGVFVAYATGSTDGSQIPKGFLMYDCETDANGIIVYGGAGVAANLDAHLPINKVTPMFYKGVFDTRDLVGLDAGAVTAMSARYVFGVLAAGAISIG